MWRQVRAHRRGPEAETAQVTEMDELINHGLRFHQINEVSFSYALRYMLHGHMMHNAPWGDDVLFASSYDPRQAANSQEKMTEPYFFQVLADGRLRVWLPTAEDLLSNQWRKV
jgi:hypothetical protein